MSDFMKFKTAVRKQFDKMAEGQLYTVTVNKDDMWHLYLDSFPEGTNEIYKERREFDCQCCKQFIRRVGAVVALGKNLETISIWDGEVEEPFKTVARAMGDWIRRHVITNHFLSNEFGAGTDVSRQLLEGSDVKQWQHFRVDYPHQYIDQNPQRTLSHKRADFQVFERSMRELSIEAGETILELIDQGSLYRGEEHRPVVKAFIKEKKSYDKVTQGKRNWCWKHAADSPVKRVRNTALGTLLIDLSANMDLNEAVTKFERVMAPENYKRPKEIFTKRMVEQAQEKIKDLGLEEALPRRHATIDDITAPNVLYMDRPAMKELDVFDELKGDVPSDPKKFDKVEEVSVDDFVEKILPHAKSLEVMMEGKHVGNLMSLIAPANPDAKTMFKWGNNFSWSYNGDIADSIKQNVKAAGGDVTGVLRFSIQWNEGPDHNDDDFDAHCKEPGGNVIMFSNKYNHTTGGNLDVDIIHPTAGTPAVENITWPSEAKMKEGIYEMSVHNYSHRKGKTGFRAQIEYNGEIYNYTYDKPLRQSQRVTVAKIQYSQADGIKFLESLDSTQSCREIWGVKTNNFVKVTSLMMSPNYWDEQKGRGNRHFFFMLDGCKTDGQPRGFYNEFLQDGLLEHKRVFEALGSKMRVPESEQQLSGLGFSSTQRNHVVARVTSDNINRVVKVNF